MTVLGAIAGLREAGLPIWLPDGPVTKETPG